MISAHIHLKSGSAIEIKNLTAINVFYSNRIQTYKDTDFALVPFKEQLPYAFIGEDKNISLSGVEIHYVEFINA